ncbi:MAG: 16S rRNA (adenine(1518)-N(6)/adenine(1519)-N(6))-dimethyltransferase RsmA, partial [Pseudomonadota bacterium]|nr:16S rRNA (adenine(1518)-N(6)/adenine(1519)-N(6))-dimethyltransferase RsmA [Pseudomonadota bacterium]
MAPPRKRFGQHFLVDAGAIDAIVRSIAPRPDESIVEIGPGREALTGGLLAGAGRLTVIEIDRDLAATLRRRPGLRVIEADVLDVDIAALADESSPAALRIVGNLPYNVSTPILFHLLAAADRIVDQHVMLQKEVVERMVAAPGSKSYGRLSVMLQWRYAMELLFEVPPEAFHPPPRVVSAVVAMRPLSLASVGAVDRDLLGEIVSVGFSQRRKLLRNTLGRWLDERGASGGFDLQR